MYIFVIQMKTKKDRMQTAAKIKSILVKDFLDAYKPNMTDQSHDFVMLITGDDLGKGVLSNTHFIGDESSYVEYLYSIIENNDNIRSIILGVSELFINRHPEYIEQQIKMAEKFGKANL